MKLYQPTILCDGNKKRIKKHTFQPVTRWQNSQTTKPTVTYLSNQVNIQIVTELSTDESQLN